MLWSLAFFWFSSLCRIVQQFQKVRKGNSTREAFDIGCGNYQRDPSDGQKIKMIKPKYAVCNYFYKLLFIFKYIFKTSL